MQTQLGVVLLLFISVQVKQNLIVLTERIATVDQQISGPLKDSLAYASATELRIFKVICICPRVHVHSVRVLTFTP